MFLRHTILAAGTVAISLAACTTTPEDEAATAVTNEEALSAAGKNLIGSWVEPRWASAPGDFTGIVFLPVAVGKANKFIAFYRNGVAPCQPSFGPSNCSINLIEGTFSASAATVVLTPTRIDGLPSAQSQPLLGSQPYALANGVLSIGEPDAANAPLSKVTSFCYAGIHCIDQGLTPSSACPGAWTCGASNQCEWTCAGLFPPGAFELHGETTLEGRAWTAARGYFLDRKRLVCTLKANYGQAPGIECTGPFDTESRVAPVATDGTFEINDRDGAWGKTVHVWGRVRPGMTLEVHYYDYDETSPVGRTVASWRYSCQGPCTTPASTSLH